MGEDGESRGVASDGCSSYRPRSMLCIRILFGRYCVLELRLVFSPSQNQLEAKISLIGKPIYPLHQTVSYSSNDLSPVGLKTRLATSQATSRNPSSVSK